MSTIVLASDGARTITIDEVGHAPGSIFLTIADLSTGAEEVCCEVDKGALFVAIRDSFGLVDPLEEALGL